MDELNELLNTQAVKVLTIHSAKGLECENVIVVGANMWKDEEIRLSYVAATRARDNLYWMSTKRKKW
jgi:superfamily I DNA/RNA helicase